MKRYTLLLILFLSLFAGKAEGQPCTADINPGNMTICYNTSPGVFTATGGGGSAYTYLWYKNGASTGVTTQTYNPGNLTATSTFYCEITSVECGTKTTTTTTITVYDELIASIGGGTSPICYSTSPGSFTATGGGGTGTYTYLWYKDGASTGVTTQTYDPGNLTATSEFYCAITSGSCGPVNTSTTTITVYGELTANISPGNTSICYNTSPGTFTATGGGGTGAYTYQWYRDGSPTVTTQTYDPGTLTSTTTFYCAITDASCGTANSSTTIITVYDVLTADISPGNTTICYNGSVTFTATGEGGTGSYLYLWYKNGVSTGQTGTTYNTGPLTTESTFYCEITSGSCGTVNTSTTTISVYPELTAGISGGTSPICYNTSPGTFTATGGGGTGTYTYLWYKDGASTGETIQTYSPGNLTTTASFYCAITSGSCGPVNTSTTTITVFDELTAGISGSTSVCLNAPAPNITFTNPQSSPVRIYYNINGGSTLSIDVNGSSSASVSVPTSSAGTFNYNLESIEYQSAPLCTNALTGLATVVVRTLPVPVISGPASACITSTGNVYITESPRTNYDWDVSAGGSVTSGGGSTNSSVTVTWNSTGAQTVRVNYTDGYGCTGASQTIYNVNVVPKPLPTNVVINGALREYSTLTVSYDYNPGVCFPENLSWTEISWYRANTVDGGGSQFITTKSGLDKTLVLSTNEYNKYIQVRVRLSDGATLMSPVSSTGWAGPVTANEKPVAVGVNISGTLKVNNTLTGNYTYSDAESDAEGATTFQWYRSSTGTGSGDPIAGATAQTYTLTKNDRDKYIRFRVTPKALTGTTPGDEVNSPWVGPVTDNPPVASFVTISGTARVSIALTGNYQYSDSEGDIEGSSVYQWYTGTNSSGAGSMPISGAEDISYILTNDEIGKYIGFSVTPIAQEGTTPGAMVTTTTWVGPVLNDPPVATISPITGSKNVNGLLTGHYVYSDVEGDIESGTLYQWYSCDSETGIYSAILPLETGIAHVINNNEQGKYFKIYITPKAATGSTTGTQVESPAYGPANSQPVASNVQITGTATIGSTLTGSYTFNDIDPGDSEGTSTFRWLRNGVIQIPGATSTSYLVTSADEGYRLSFEVTPVSSSGYPDTGTPVQSAQTTEVIDPSLLTPVASEVCIEGIRTAGQILRGKYYYNFYKSEGISTYQWYRDGVPIPGATGIQYTLQQVEDIDSNADITFEVTPKSSNIPPKEGASVESNPLSRIIIPKDYYSVSESDVVLSANVPGGVYSGTGVSGNIFSPSTAGSAGSPHTLSYLLLIVNTNHNCSQQSSRQVTVNPNVAFFVGFDPLYCHDSGPDIITVSGVPGGSTDLDFTITDINGIVDEAGTTVTIDPGRMRPGAYNDVLYFSYRKDGIFYQISEAFNIDSVGTEIRIINLDPAYCQGDPKEYISIEGVYPLGGTATWAGDIFSDTKAASAYADPSLGTPGSTYPVSYQYRSPNGCYSEILSHTVTINPLPDPSFSLNSTYNIDGGPVTLIPVQAGGTFSGNGVSGDKLFPDIAGLGEYEIKYTITDANNCIANLGKKTIIRKAQGSFTDLPPVICYSDTTYNVKVTGLPASVTITGFTNTKNSLDYTPGATNANYNVPAAGAGNDTLTFSYKWDGVDYSISATTNVDSLGQAVIKNLASGQIICDNEAPFELFPSITGGSFTGPVSGNYLDPTKASGPASVSYTYTNLKTGCSTSTTIPVTIYPAPKVAFAPEDVCIENDADTTFFINNTISSDSMQSWLWEFTDAGTTLTSIEKNAGYMYKSGGLQKVALTATTIYSCSATKEATFNLGIKPDADFYWKNDCMHPDDSIILVDTTFSTSLIVSRSWRILNGAEFSTDEKEARYLKSDTGYLRVQYIVRTGYANCFDTVSKDIYIRPSIIIPADGYFENFEAGNGGWVKGETTGNTWSFGTPDRSVIDSASSGQNAWFTGFRTDTAIIESSSIVSPCFDFKTAERPIIKIKLWRRFEKDRDGAALQYKIGDSKAWQYIGTLNDGIEWYNSAVIRGAPGGNQLGWTGTTDNGWEESIHTFDELKGKSDVKFRMVYGSDGTTADRDGIAFDDIWIGERTRKVLLEHFTNTSSRDGSEATEMVNEIALKKEEDVINIQYHTNFPGNDPYYNDNQGDASARILFYGLIKTPYTIIDGGNKTDFANIFDYVLADIDSNDVTRRSMINPLFRITLNSDISGGILTVKGDLTALEEISSDNITNITLYLAVTEKENNEHTGARGENIFYNVFRKFIPDAGGINLKTTWTKGETYTFPEQSWLIEKIKSPSDIEVIAFLQNNNSKELYQAASVTKQKITVGIEDLFSRKRSDFALYPNPAVNKLTITFEEPLSREADIRIYDTRGVVITSYKTGSGISAFSIDDLNLKGGIYLLRITAKGVDLGFRKLVVSGD